MRSQSDGSLELYHHYSQLLCNLMIFIMVITVCTWRIAEANLPFNNYYYYFTVTILLTSFADKFNYIDHISCLTTRVHVHT